MWRRFLRMGGPKRPEPRDEVWKSPSRIASEDPCTLAIGSTNDHAPSALRYVPTRKHSQTSRFLPLTGIFYVFIIIAVGGVLTRTEYSMHPQPRKTKLAAKKNRILNEIFRGVECSRFDLARRLNINATMVGTYVREFLKDGLLVEGEGASAGRGRSPTPLKLKREYGCFLGLDFEALRARAVLCDFRGEVLLQEEVPFTSGATRRKVVRSIVALGRRMADKADRRLLSVGVAAPGQVDCRRGRVLHYGLLPDFDDVRILDAFQKTIDVPVFVEDNIRAVAYGELLRGAGRGRREFLCLTVRSGVGLGIVIDGKLYSGAGAFAGEAGYMVFPSGEGPRIMTDLVSAKGFVQETLRLLRSRQGTTERQRLLAKADDLTLEEIVAAAEAGDSLLRERLEILGSHLGMLAANLANLFSPEAIILAGEVPNLCGTVRLAMGDAFRKYTLPQILEITRLDNGELGVFAGPMGAAYLGFARTFPEDERSLVGPTDDE